jgi:hypothetical protein
MHKLTKRTRSIVDLVELNCKIKAVSGDIDKIAYIVERSSFYKDKEKYGYLEKFIHGIKDTSIDLMIEVNRFYLGKYDESFKDYFYNIKAIILDLTVKISEMNIMQLSPVKSVTFAKMMKSSSVLTENIKLQSMFLSKDRLSLDKLHRIIDVCLQRTVMALEFIPEIRYCFFVPEDDIRNKQNISVKNNNEMPDPKPDKVDEPNNQMPMGPIILAGSSEDLNGHMQEFFKRIMGNINGEIPEDEDLP